MVTLLYFPMFIDRTSTYIYDVYRDMPYSSSCNVSFLPVFGSELALFSTDGFGALRFLGSQGSGIELAGSIGGCNTLPTLMYFLCSAKNFFQ